jgi:hypothetical protein
VSMNQTVTLDSATRTMSCGFGALALTAIMTWAFLDSTASVQATGAVVASAHSTRMPIQSRHLWFGQSQPAALVD